RQRKRKWSEAF
nr:Chain B, B141NLS [synthetic construct]3ZIR_C Chain C, B141NLS [synthetic construct]